MNWNAFFAAVGVLFTFAAVFWLSIQLGNWVDENHGSGAAIFTFCCVWILVIALIVGWAAGRA